MAVAALSVVAVLGFADDNHRSLGCDRGFRFLKLIFFDETGCFKLNLIVWVKLDLLHDSTDQNSVDKNVVNKAEPKVKIIKLTIGVTIFLNSRMF